MQVVPGRHIYERDRRLGLRRVRRWKRLRDARVDQLLAVRGRELLYVRGVGVLAVPGGLVGKHDRRIRLFTL
jgi:hypothetical protein